ncbi:MAG: aminopeptidase [Pseudomonadales bacterium]
MCTPAGSGSVRQVRCSGAARLALLLALIALGGCQTLGYYGHLTLGQLGLVRQREPVADVLRRLDAEPAPSPRDLELRQRLRLSQDVLAFAHDRLALDVGGRYRTYVALHEPYVVWNLFAAPELSLEPHRWCYPLLGCAPYRGYFSRARAERAGAALRERGMDVYLGGVAAYSTLGWFADPLLSTFIYWPEDELAALLLHELAHGVVWVRDDVAFNESFATFVAREGLAEWRRDRQLPPAPQGADGSAWPRLRNLLLTLRARLDLAYRESADDGARRAAKSRLIAAARECYLAQRGALGGGRYDAVMAQLNNALLLSIATYEDLVPAFAALFAAEGGDWPAFYRAVQALGRTEAAQRRQRLAASGNQQVADARDDEGADEVQCEALSGHGFDAEAAGAVHDDVGRGGDREHERT